MPLPCMEGGPFALCTEEIFFALCAPSQKRTIMLLPDRWTRHTWQKCVLNEQHTEKTCQEKRDKHPIRKEKVSNARTLGTEDKAIPPVTRPMELANGADPLWIGRSADLLLDLRGGVQEWKSQTSETSGNTERQVVQPRSACQHQNTQQASKLAYNQHQAEHQQQGWKLKNSQRTIKHTIHLLGVISNPSRQCSVRECSGGRKDRRYIHGATRLERILYNLSASAASVILLILRC